MILGKNCVFPMEERGHRAGHVTPPEWSQRTAIRTHENMTERQVALLGSIGLSAFVISPASTNY